MKFLTKSYIVLVLLTLIILPIEMFAQNSTSSPYSYFGYGDMANVAYGKNLSMGGTGYAIRDKNHLNLKNPASLTSIDSLSVLFEMGVFFKATQNKTTTERNYAYDGNLTHLTLGHRINSRFMMSFGFMPYSEIGYHFRTVNNVQGELSAVYTDWSGSGGISKYFLAFGAKVTKRLSIGIEPALLHGPVTRTINTTALVSSANTSTLVYNTQYVGFDYKGAFQYHLPLGDKGTAVTIGGTYSPGQIFAGETNVDISQYYQSSQSIIYSREGEWMAYDVPLNYGGGLGFTYRGKYFLTADYEATPWGTINGGQYKDRQVFSVGIEKMSQESLKYMERIAYRAGFRYDTGYFDVNNITVNDLRFSAGFGMPMQKSRSTINVSMELGQRGTLNAGMIRERYGKLTVALSFHDYWFIKRKID